MLIRIGPKSEEIKRIEASYFQRDAAAEHESVKQPERQKVLAHIIKYHSADRLKLFSLPGLHWQLEHELDLKMPATFVGVERIWSVLQDGARLYMPGNRLRLFREELTIGTLHGYENSKSRVIWCEAGSLLTMSRNCKQSKMHQRQGPTNTNAGQQPGLILCLCLAIA